MVWEGHGGPIDRRPYPDCVGLSLAHLPQENNKEAAGCQVGVLPAMGPIGPAAGPATSRRFLLGPIQPMPVTRSTYIARGLSFQIIFCLLKMAKIIRSTLLLLVKQLIGRVRRLTSLNTRSMIFVVLSFTHISLGHS